jgi:chaperonin GroES
MNTPKFRPAGKRILILPEPIVTKTESGLILTEVAADENKVRRGTLIAIGSKVDPTEFKAGEEVLYSSYADTKVELEGQEYIIAVDEDIYGAI